MELHRLHAQLHDRLPRPLWGVDRVDVGLHVGVNTFPQKMPDLIFHEKINNLFRWVASKVCVPFFLATVVIGNLVVSFPH